MSKKETLSTLINKDKPYETVSLVILLVMLFQQFSLLMIRLIQFLTPDNFIDSLRTANLTTPTFFARIVTIDDMHWVFILLGFLALILFYGLVYVFVFRHCEQNNYAKWTWTLIVLFGPVIIFIPPVYIYAAFVFRKHLMNFLHTLVAEFKALAKEPKKEKQG